MKYVEIVADPSSSATIVKVAEKAKAQDVRLAAISEDGLRQMRLLVSDDNVQLTLDLLQNILGAQPSARIAVLPVETFLPKPDDEKRKQEDSATAAREALYESVEKSAQLTLDYLVLIVLSTIVAAVGLVESNVAVLIGAMVIAPLLGPNLALSLGTALGDLSLMRQAAKTLAVGIALAVLLSAGMGMIWEEGATSPELLARTEAGLDSVALALASGAAAALSMTTGLSSVLVGVMVAVALLPPAATMGFLLGAGLPEAAIGAGLLLGVNIVSVNLSSKVVFFLKSIRPRTWLEKEKARKAMAIYIIVWIATLLIMISFIYAKKRVMIS
ncbi:MAG: TIGR00341 family protein [Deltaproteobacteria bacterium]|nr:TIGR00341 family protein [Deltaproteobacteria bacterium]